MQFIELANINIRLRLNGDITFISNAKEKKYLLRAEYSRGDVSEIYF